MNMHVPERVADRQGMALVFALVLVLIAGTIITTALATTSSVVVVSQTSARESLLQRVADEGLEFGRASLNANPDLYPPQGYATLENGVSMGGTNQQSFGAQRWTYVGPSGDTSGQYGVFGSVVSVVRDAGGGVVVRRSQLFQESFARFAYFTDVEPRNIYFGGGDQIFGPLHTNDEIKVHSTGATFHSEVRTAKTVTGASYGDFRVGYEEGAEIVVLPDTRELDELRVQAQAGMTHFVAPGGGTTPTLRIEFVALDLNADGSLTGENEGFIRVYQSTDAEWLLGRVPSGGMRYSRTCGHYHNNGDFVAAADHGTSGNDSWSNALRANADPRCYLGGADSISNGFQANDSSGSWIRYLRGPSPLVAGRPDQDYLIPITRPGNPDFKGVIFVDGNVALSGTVRSRVTVAATGQIHVADDVTYATAPGTGVCDDILGIFSGSDVVISDNTLNAPVQPGPGNNWVSYDDTVDEHVHAVVLTLSRFTVENYATGSTQDERCEGAQWGRGCLYLAGGIIQQSRGPVGTLRPPGGTGYLKRYSYDQCGATAPPPYFPTTGHFFRGAAYEVNPIGFDVDAYFDFLGG